MLLISASASVALGGMLRQGLESVEGSRTFVPEPAGLRVEALNLQTTFSLTATIGSALRHGTDTLSVCMESAIRRVDK